MHVKKILSRGIKYNETNSCVPITHFEEWNISSTLIAFPFHPALSQANHSPEFDDSLAIIYSFS